MVRRWLALWDNVDVVAVFRDDATWRRTSPEIEALFEPDYAVAWIAQRQRVIEASGLDDSRREQLLGRPRLEDDERNLAIGALLVVPVAAVEINHPRPQARVLRGRRHASSHGPSPGPDLNRRVRIRTQVVEPRRVLWMPALRRDDDELFALAHVRERRGASLAGLGTDVVQQQHRRGTGESVADEAMRGAVDDGVSLYRLPEHGPQPVGDLPVVKSRAHGVSASPTSPAARTKHIIRSASSAIADAGLSPPSYAFSFGPARRSAPAAGV